MPAIRLYSKYIIVLLGLTISCNETIVDKKDILEQNLKRAGKNRSELEKVLTFFSKNPQDSLKYKAAVFLISNLQYYYDYSGEWPNRFEDLFFDRVGILNNDDTQKLRDSIEAVIGNPTEKNNELLPDLEHLSSDFIINNIETAYQAWQAAPWVSQVSFDSFCNYILPYKSSAERTENWRLLLNKRYLNLMMDSTIPKTMVDICCALIDEQSSWFHWTSRFGYFPGILNFSQILRTKKGSCNEMANLGAYAARSLGIPVAYDYTPQYGNDNDNHKWNALILSDSAFIPFEGGEARPGDMALTGELEQKFAKVFRQQMIPVNSSFASIAEAKGMTDIPDFLMDPRIRDVTSGYTAVSDITLKVDEKDGNAVYLCVFSRRSFVAVEGGFIRNKTVSFKSMGRGLVYLPMYYSKGSYTPAGNPFLLTSTGQINTYQLNFGSKQTLALRRKYPFKRRWIKNLYQYMEGARFEGSNDSGFVKPTLLYQIPTYQLKYFPGLSNDLDLKDKSSYDSFWNAVNLTIPDSFQYVRLVFDKGRPFRLAEMEFYSKENALPLRGSSLGNVPNPELAIDGFPGLSIRLRRDTSKKIWAGLDLGTKRRLDRIRYLPDPDRNEIEPGKTYELFYWNNKWVSGGIQLAKGYQLVYNNIPSGGIYWLNCKDCITNEERIFSYTDGKQLWW